MQSEVLELIFEGESETLELKTTIRDPQLLCKLIGSFANAKGGRIVIGVKEPAEIVGADEFLTRKVYEAAKKRLVPAPTTKLTVLETEGKSVAIIEVQRSEEIVLSDGSAFIRAGTMTQPMAWVQMREHLPAQPNVATVESLTKAIEHQSKKIEEMHAEIRVSNSWQVRWKEWAIGFGLGIPSSTVARVTH